MSRKRRFGSHKDEDDRSSRVINKSIKLENRFEEDDDDDDDRCTTPPVPRSNPDHNKRTVSSKNSFETRLSAGVKVNGNSSCAYSLPKQDPIPSTSTRTSVNVDPQFNPNHIPKRIPTTTNRSQKDPRKLKGYTKKTSRDASRSHSNRSIRDHDPNASVVINASMHLGNKQPPDYVLVRIRTNSIGDRRRSSETRPSSLESNPDIKRDKDDKNMTVFKRGFDNRSNEANNNVLPPVENFFSFNTTTQLQPKLPVIFNAQINPDEVPPPKPKQAHYHTLSPNDELSYVTEGRDETEAIPLYTDKNGINKDEDDDTDAEEELKEGTSATTNKIIAEAISKHCYGNDAFTKFDFDTYKVQPNGLPLWEKREMILRTLDTNRIVIIEGFTGCGKTTQIPQYILDQCRINKTFCNVVVTQPRKIAAISAAKRVCYERNWHVGSVVGYQVGMETKQSSDTCVTFMTLGVLLQKVIGQKSLTEFSHIIIDEVHERDLDSDFLLLIVKRILAGDKNGKESHVKVILMSATIDTKAFQKYFQFRVASTGEYKSPPVVQIPLNQRFKIDEIYLDDLVKNKESFDSIASSLDKEKASLNEKLNDIAYKCIIGLDEIEKMQNPDPRLKTKTEVEKKRGAVLVFLPGIGEINSLLYLLERNKTRYKWATFVLHSTMSSIDQMKVYDSPGDYFRKIILATNIAESSITVSDVVYVIDFCLNKTLCIDKTTNFTTLRMMWASKSQCVQRRGRCGRVAPGKVFRLVPKSFYHALDKDAEPEMKRSNLETIVLMCKKADLDTPKGLLRDALEPPNLSGIQRAVSTLKELGALTITKEEGIAGNKRKVYDKGDGDLTFLGLVMATLPIPQQCTRLIMLGHCFGVMKEAIIIAAGLSVKSPYKVTSDKQLDTYLVKLRHSQNSFSDLLAFYHVYKTWLVQFGKTGRTDHAVYKWALDSMVHLPVLEEIKKTVDLIEKRLKSLEIKDNYELPTTSKLKVPWSERIELTSEEGMFLKLSIAGAFYPNYFLRREPRNLDEYDRDLRKEVNGLDVFRTVKFKGFHAENSGELYAKHIADHLAHGKNVPMVKFDGQKAFAVFDGSTGEKIGPFSVAMFRAIKLEQLRINLEFNVLNFENEPQYLNKCRSELNKRRFIKCPELRELPSVDVGSVKIHIKHIVSPSQFWAILEQDSKQLAELEETILTNTADPQQRLYLPKSKFFPNCICLAPYEGAYYRAKVLRIQRDIMKCLVYFIDYGNTEWVENSNLLDFNPYMTDCKGIHKMPGMAIECRLREVKPNTIHGLEWTRESVQLMKRFCKRISDTADFEIYSISQSIMAGDLLVDKCLVDVPKPGESFDGVRASFRDYLINVYEDGKVYGETSVEPYMSRQNHKLRNEADEMDEVRKRGVNKEQRGECLNFDFIEPPPNARQPVRLKGPTSPLQLERNFNALVQCSTTKEVKVDTNSVNSVLLDHEPTTSRSRLIVASNIAVADTSKAVMIRESTVMSAIPGILQLVCMIFAPKVELRTDRYMTKYTGLLCGCGTVPYQEGQEDLNNDPVHPDNDMEVVFDTEIDDEDIDKINRIRCYLNKIMKESGTPNVNMSEIHKDLRVTVIKLLQRRREKIEYEIAAPEEYIWNRISKEYLLPVNLSRDLCFTHNDIFQPHSKIKLETREVEDVSWIGGF